MTDHDVVRALLQGADSPRDLSAAQRTRLLSSLGAESDVRTAALLQAAAGPRPLPAGTRSALVSRLAHPRASLVAAPRLHTVVGAVAAVVLLAGVVSAVVRPVADVGPVARPAPTPVHPTQSASGQPPRVEPHVGGVTGPAPSPVPSASLVPSTAPPAPLMPPGAAPEGGPAGAPAAPGSGAPPWERSVFAVTPDAGALAGGTLITIHGTGLVSTVRVEVGRRAATDVHVESDSRVTARTPSGAQPGSVDVVVVMADGVRYGLSPGFTYVAAPVLSSVSPDRGPMSGGNTVVLSGTHLDVGTVVRFGTTEAEVVEASSTTVRVVVPAHLPGPVDVTVTTVGGTSDPRRYTYLPG